MNQYFSFPYLRLIEISDLNVKRLTESELQSGGFRTFSLGDVYSTFLIKVLTR